MSMHYVARRDEHAEQAFLATRKFRADGTRVSFSREDHDACTCYRHRHGRGLAPDRQRQRPNPRHLAATAWRLAAAQRDLARKKRGSSRRRKDVAKVARLQGRYAASGWTTRTRPPWPWSAPMA